MSKHCPMSNTTTNCTDHCRDCAKEVYRDLKGMCGNGIFCISEEGIKEKVGANGFDLLIEYGFIKFYKAFGKNITYTLGGN